MKRDPEAVRMAAEYDHELATVMWQLGEDPAGHASDQAHEVARARIDRARRPRTRPEPCHRVAFRHG